MVAVGAAVAAVSVMAVAVRSHPWSVPGVLLALPAAVVAGWHVVSRRGLVRVVAGLLAVTAVVAPVLHVLAHRPSALAISMGLFGVSMACARLALGATGRRPRPFRRRGRCRMPQDAAAWTHPVLLINRLSGRGVVDHDGVAALARRAGVEVVEAAPGQDLGLLADRVARRGATLLGVAGGDGSVAAVAAVAAREGLPLVCVPVGTRNHFALDLGVDPHDLAAAVSALRHGGLYRVDLAQVNGRIFVNNVSLGLYGALVGSPHYRQSVVLAALAELPDVLGPGSQTVPLRLVRGDARPGCPDAVTAEAVTAEAVTARTVLISNNAYRLGGLGHGAWRPSLSSGTLGIITLRLESGPAVARLAWLELFGRGHRSADYRRWATRAVTIDADQPVLAGIDGEAITLVPPVRVTSLPGALTVSLPRPGVRDRRTRYLRETWLLLRSITTCTGVPATRPGSRGRGRARGGVGAQRRSASDPGRPRGWRSAVRTW